MAGTVDVWIRYGDESVGKRLGSWPVFLLDELISTIKRWGLDCDPNVDLDETFGQFRYDHSGFYFEVVLPDRDAE